MKQKYYKYLSDEECLWFEFESVSKQKTVKKVIVYSPFQESTDVFNLGLVDVLEDGSYSDKTVTNNDDMPIVMTISTPYFFERIQKSLKNGVY
jgi:hypothetical protein